jgi:hypothetical protein
MTEADMLVGTDAWFFVSGDKSSELHRLDRLVAVLLTVHALRKAEHKVEKIILFQMITGLTLELTVDAWVTAELLTAFIQARVNHS